ncbi:MAG: hypothetical protein ACPGWR_13505 [Ardenticatenaceae bacterium]
MTHQRPNQRATNDQGQQTNDPSTTKPMSNQWPIMAGEAGCATFAVLRFIKEPTKKAR